MYMCVRERVRKCVCVCLLQTRALPKIHGRRIACYPVNYRS